MSPAVKAFAPILAAAVAIVAWNSFYTISMTEQVIITKFGKVQGNPISEPGLHLKTPFVDVINRLDKRVLEWDSREPIRMSTKDKVYLEVDTFARWRITDPLQFYIRMRDERGALSRLDDILGSNARSTVANHDLIELIRTDKDRKVNPDAVPAGSEAATLAPIREGRVAVEEAILKQASPAVKEFGIELLDVRFKRVNYSRDVLAKIYDRMISERAQIAERFRSEGGGESARIQGTRELELNRITSEAYRKVQEIKGTAEATASAIYAKAFNSSPEAAEFYNFQKTLETYEKTFSTDTTAVFSTSSDLFQLLKNVSPAMLPAIKVSAPAAKPAPAPSAPSSTPVEPAKTTEPTTPQLPVPVE